MTHGMIINHISYAYHSNKPTHLLHTAAGLPLVRQLLQTLVAAPFALWNVYHLQAFAVVHLGTGVAAQHFSILPALLAALLVG